MSEEYIRPNILDSPRRGMSSVEVLRSILPDDTYSMNADIGLSTAEYFHAANSKEVNLDKIETLSEAASMQKSTILNRLQHSLRQLHDMREHFEEMLKDENIEALQNLSLKLQNVTKNLFTQLNQVMDQRDDYADKADVLKKSLLQRDQELIKVMKREEIHVKKLRESAFQQKRLKEKRDEIIQFMFEKAEEFELSVPELKHLYQSISVFYDNDKIKPVELHGKYGIKTQMTDAEYRTIVPNENNPPVPGKVVNVVIDFSVMKDNKTIEMIRQQIQKDSIWHLRTTDLRERSMNDLLKQIESYYVRDDVPLTPNFKDSVIIRKEEIPEEEIEKLCDIKVEPTQNLSFKKTKFNVNRMINEIYAAQNGNTPQDVEIRNRNIAQLNELRAMIMESLTKFDPHMKQLHMSMKDDIEVLRARCQEIKDILKQFIEDYEAFKKSVWNDFLKIRNAVDKSFHALQNKIDKLTAQVKKLQEENEMLKKNLPVQTNQQSTVNTMGALPPIDEPIQVTHSPLRLQQQQKKPQTSHAIYHPLIHGHEHHHHDHEHVHDPHSPLFRPCCNQVIPQYFKDLPKYKFGDSQKNLSQVDVSLWFQESIEPKPRPPRERRHLHTPQFLSRSYQ